MEDAFWGKINFNGGHTLMEDYLRTDNKNLSYAIKLNNKQKAT